MKVEVRNRVTGGLIGVISSRWLPNDFVRRGHFAINVVPELPRTLSPTSFSEELAGNIHNIFVTVDMWQFVSNAGPVRLPMLMVGPKDIKHLKHLRGFRRA